MRMSALCEEYKGFKDIMKAWKDFEKVHHLGLDHDDFDIGTSVFVYNLWISIDGCFIGVHTIIKAFGNVLGMDAEIGLDVSMSDHAWYAIPENSLGA